MKTSNIIITAFAILLVGSMFFLFADTVKHTKDEIAKISFKEYPISKSFTVIVAEKGSDVNIVRSDTTSMRVEYRKGGKAPAKLYEVVNDTLFVYRGLRTFVKCDNITTVIGRHQWWFGVYNFSPDLIKLRSTGGTVTYSNEGIEEKPFNIDLAVSDSASIEIKNVNLKNLNVIADNGHVNLNCHIQNVTGKITKFSSLLGAESAQNITLQRDITSSFRERR